MSILDDYTWPSEYPKGVPPKDTSPAQGLVYRAVKSFPPTENDFLSTRDENPRRTYNTQKKKILSYGVSFFERKSVLEDKIRRYKPLKDKVIVKGDLDKSLGVISAPEYSGHITLWKCDGAMPSQYINLPV